jgi:hypothetical protein
MSNVKGSSRLIWLALILLVANLAYFLLWPVFQPAAPTIVEQPKGVAPLVLLHEVPVAAEADAEFIEVAAAETTALPVPVAEEEVPDTSNIEPKREPLCWWAGPFSAGEVDNINLSPGVELELPRIVRPTVVGVEYWVYLATEEDAVDAATRLRQLQAADIEVFEISSGTLQGKLSLGVFREELLARALLDERLSQDYPAELVLLERVQPREWLLLSEANKQTLGWAEGAGPPGDWPVTRMEAADCPAPLPELPGLPAKAE